MTFPHLAAYSAYSAHYGVATPTELVAAAAEQGATHLGIADRDGLYGAVKHVGACLQAGIVPLIGVDLALADPTGRHAIGRLLVLARGHDGGGGYGDLCELVSAAHAPVDPALPRGLTVPQSVPGMGGLDGSDDTLALLQAPSVPGEGRTSRETPPAAPLRGAPRITAARLAQSVARGHGRFLVLLGPDSDVGRLAAARRTRRARTALLAWRRLLGPERVRVHLVNHLTRPGTPRSIAHAARMLDLAQETGVVPVLGNAVRYARPDQAVTADLLDAARGLSALGASHPQPNGQGWLKPPADMHRIAGQIASAAAGTLTAADLIAGTRHAAELCSISPATDLGYGTPTVPEAHLTGVAQEPLRELRARCETALHRIYGDRAERTVPGPGIGREHWESPRQRMERELATIESLGFSSYFLTVAHVSRLIGSLGIRHAARGSGVSSLVNYLLDVSRVDPLEYGLVFERFLSTRRSTLPDIDIDVESARRHEIYRAVVRHYGPQRVTLMSMHNGYRARGAVRDAARALGLPQETTDRIATAIWRIPAGELRERLPHQPELAGLREEAARNPRVDLLIDLVERLDRLPRHLSMHPCGVILSNASLLRRTPVQPSGMGLSMSQFDKHDMDPMGLLKLDVLGVRMQSTLAHTLAEIRRTTGQEVDLESIDVHDEPTFELIRSTHTLGCFQIESPGQRELIGKMQPTSVEDLIVDISLYRPGPMQTNMVRPYLDSRHGFAEPHRIHPRLDPLLAETAGVMVFHEQVLTLMDRMTGAGLATADEWRRALGKAGQDEMEARFRAAARTRGYPQAVIDEVWENLESFGSFGFCKAHGAAFAIPTYQSAWLKAHFPAHFMTGVLEHDPGMYPQRLLLADARRLGIRLLPLDVNRSTDRYRVQKVGRDVPGDGEGTGWGIRVPLTQVSGISRTEIQRIITHAPYASVADLKARARPHRPTLNRLAALGALDAAVFQTPAHEVEGQEEGQERGRQEAGEPREGGGQDAHRQEAEGPRHPAAIPLQLALPLGPRLESPFPDRDTTDLADTLATELDLLALDLSAHLMAGYAERLEQWPLTPAADLLRLRNKTEVWVAGVRVSTMTPPMNSGKRVVFISLDDGTGCVDAAFFDEAQALTGTHLFGTPMLLIRGTTRRSGPRGISLTALQAWDLTQLLQAQQLPFLPIGARG